MRTTFKFLLIAVLMVSAFTVSAQQKVKIGYIASDQLMQAMPEMKKVQEVLKKKQEDALAEMNNLRQQYQVLISDYSQKQNTYSDITKKSKEQEIQSMGERINRFEQTVSQELNKTRGELVQPIIDKATKAIEAVGKEKGFTYILDTASGVIVYKGAGAIDVMPFVKAKLKIK